MRLIKTMLVAAVAGLGPFVAAETCFAADIPLLETIKQGTKRLVCRVIGCVDDVQYHRIGCEPDACTPAQLRAAVEKVTMFVENHGWKVLDADPQEKPGKRSYRAAVYRQAWLEYRDKGEPFEAAQKAAVVQALSDMRDEKGPIYVVVYVHGWHHNASVSDQKIGNNAIKFKYFMARHVEHARRLLESRGVAEKPNVLGIYVGWRGETSKLWTNFATIGDRAAAADRLGLGRPKDSTWASDLKTDLGEIANELRTVDPDGRMMVVGHSLGGRVLTRAFVDDFTDGAPPLGSGTLIVTLNAAVGADCFDKRFGKGTQQNAAERPTWINVTSKDDVATRLLYPAARWTYVASPPSCKDSGPARNQTIGHRKDYLTHSMIFRSFGAKDKPMPTTPEEASKAGLPATAPEYPPLPAETDWFSGPPISRTLAYTMRDVECTNKSVQRCYNPRSTLFYAMTFNSKDASDRAGALWNIETDKDTINIVDNNSYAALHNGYVSTNLTRMLVELIYAK